MFEILTTTQRRIMGLSAIGHPSKEIAEETDSTENTVNTHLKNIKDRIKEEIGRSYKLSELRFLFLCESLGKSSESIKIQILSASICILFLLSIPTDHLDKRRFRLRTRKEHTTISIDYTSI